jgi:hypothetical protein
MASTTPSTTPEAEAQEKQLPKAAELISAYLAANVKQGEVGTADLPAPFVNEDGRVFIHTRGLWEWMDAEHGPGIKKSQAEGVLREAGFTGPAVRPLPGLGVNVAFRNAVKPKGVSIKDLPVREKAPKAAAAKAEAPAPAEGASAEKAAKTAPAKKAAPRKRAATKAKAKAGK